MSHELRTPLNAVIGFSEVLLEADVRGPQREAGGIPARHSADHRGRPPPVPHQRHSGPLQDRGRAHGAGGGELRTAARLSTTPSPWSRDARGARGIALAVVDGRPARRVPRATSARSSRSCSTCSPTPSSSRPRAAGSTVRAEPRGRACGGLGQLTPGSASRPRTRRAVFEEFRQVGTDYAMKREGTGLGARAVAASSSSCTAGRIWVKSALGRGLDVHLHLAGEAMARKLQLHLRGARVEGQFGDSSEYGGGAKWYFPADRAAVAQRRADPGPQCSL